MSSVTGSDLKRRVVRYHDQASCAQAQFQQKAIARHGGNRWITLPVFFGLADTQARAQAAAENPTQNIADTWQGTLHAGKDLRTVVKISKADGSGYKAVFYSIDQGGSPLPVTKITLEGTTVKMSLTAIGGTYEGKLSADGKTITGNWSQGPTPLPLNLTRATPETEWTIPPPPPKMPPMDANASPTFEVATIKPSKPDEQGKAFLVQGRRFKTINVTLSEMMSFAYGVTPSKSSAPRLGRPPINSISTRSLTGKACPTTSNGKACSRS